MRTVKQKHPDGCGIACIATLTTLTRKKKSYDDLRAEMFPFRTPENTIKRWLREYGIRTGAAFKDLNGRDYRSLEFNALLAVNYWDDEQLWHWVIWDAGAKKIRDPQKSDGKKRRYSAKRYLKIYPKAVRRSTEKQSLRT